jgi:hypothetical protein
MARERIGRRELIMGGGAGAVALAAVTLPATAAFADDDHRQGGGLQGAWLITRHDDSAPNTAITSVVTFATGGAFAEMDINPPSPVGLGSWSKSGDHRFAVTFWSVALDVNTFQGSVKVTVDGSWKGDTITGTYTFSVLDPSGNGTVLVSGTGSFTGTRIIAGQ